MRGATVSILVAGAFAAAVLLPTGGAAAARPAEVDVSAPAVARVLTCVGNPEVRPANYLMSCADANASWKKVSWATWGSKSATGSGELYQNDCTPNCAAGRFRTYAAKVVLSEVIKTKKYGALYSKATFSYSVKDKRESEIFGLAT